MRDLELESEYEFENQSELLGEYEGALEGFGEGESAFGETPLSEFEYEGAYGESLGEGAFGESEWESQGALEGEQFFGNVFKKVAGFVRKAAPMLKNVVKTAAPLVGGAIGGPIGSTIASAASNLLGESEFEGELEFEFEGESEAEMEAVMEGPMNEQQVLGELMAAAASRATTDMEAEAQIGAATAIVLSRADLAALRDVLPNINRGVAVLTRILRRNRGTRDAVRAIPTIIKRSAVSLRKRAERGEPVTRDSAARTVASQTRRVLGTPSVCAKAIGRNVQATRKATSNASGNGRSRRPQRYTI
jgi:hypothetical protein